MSLILIYQQQKVKGGIVTDHYLEWIKCKQEISRLQAKKLEHEVAIYEANAEALKTGSTTLAVGSYKLKVTHSESWKVVQALADKTPELFYKKYEMTRAKYSARSEAEKAIIMKAVEVKENKPSFTIEVLNGD